MARSGMPADAAGVGVTLGSGRGDGVEAGVPVGVAAGNLQVFVAHTHDRQDRTAAIGLDDRVDARIEPRANERLDIR